MAKEKFLLAYSGGLDTSIIIPWLLEHYDCEVVAYCGEVGVGVDKHETVPVLEKVGYCIRQACVPEGSRDELT